MPLYEDQPLWVVRTETGSVTHLAKTDKSDTKPKGGTLCGRSINRAAPYTKATSENELIANDASEWHASVLGREPGTWFRNATVGHEPGPDRRVPAEYHLAFNRS